MEFHWCVWVAAVSPRDSRFGVVVISYCDLVLCLDGETVFPGPGGQVYTCTPFCTIIGCLSVLVHVTVWVLRFRPGIRSRFPQLGDDWPLGHSETDLGCQSRQETSLPIRFKGRVEQNINNCITTNQDHSYIVSLSEDPSLVTKATLTLVPSLTSKAVTQRQRKSWLPAWTTWSKRRLSRLA